VARRSGLGKGLGALIPTGPDVEPGRGADHAAEAETGAPAPDGGAGASPLASDLREVAVAAVRPNRFQPRKAFDEESLAALAASIAEVGVLQPILVRPIGDEDGHPVYELIAGERRLRACKRVGLPTVPAIVRDVNDLASMEQAVVENLHRRDLNPLEEAAAFQQLLDDFGLTHDRLAKRVGKSRTTITNLLRLFQLPPTVQKLVRDGELAEGHARALLGLGDAAAIEAAAGKVVAGGLSVRATEDLVRNRLAGAATGKPPRGDRTPGRTKEAGLLELEQLLGDLLSTRVLVEIGPSKGKMVVEFADLDDLERIYRAMTGG
jgi:ParB family chromosome partitioning protein